MFPLIKKETLEELINSSDDGLSILTTILEDPYGYGRVKKDDSGNASGNSRRKRCVS